MPNDAETQNRAMKAMRLITQLRLDLDALDETAERDPEASHLFVVANGMKPLEWDALSVRARLSRPPSTETVQMAILLLSAMVEIEERYSTLPPVRSLLR